MSPLYRSMKPVGLGAAQRTLDAKRRGTKVTTLFVTHDLAEAIQLSYRLFFLSDRQPYCRGEK